MQVYKAYFKIIKKNLIQLSIYVVVFILFAIILGRVSTDADYRNFESTKVNIAFINNDKDSKIISNLKDYLEKNTNIVSIGKTKEQKQDALYFSEVEYIVTVPKGFTDKILKGDKDANIEKCVVPNSVSEVFVDNLINRYLNTARKYVYADKGISQSQLVSNINKDVDHNTKVKIQTYKDAATKNYSCSNYYNFFAYSVFAILILGVSAVMITFNSKDLKRRNLASSMSLSKYNAQIVFANISFAFIVWFIMVLVSLVLYKDYMFTINGSLLLLNSLIFTFASLSIALLVSSFIVNKNATSAAANVIALGSSFISGVFVPQQYLGNTVLSIAKFSPTYWYVKANDSIGNLVNYSNDNLRSILINIFIVMGFALAFYAVNLVVVKQKRVSN